MDDVAGMADENAADRCWRKEVANHLHFARKEAQNCRLLPRHLLDKKQDVIRTAFTPIRLIPPAATK